MLQYVLNNVILLLLLLFGCCCHFFILSTSCLSNCIYVIRERTSVLRAVSVFSILTNRFSSRLTNRFSSATKYLCCWCCFFLQTCGVTPSSSYLSHFFLASGPAPSI